MSRPTIRIGSSADLPFLREMLFEAAFWRVGRVGGAWTLVARTPKGSGRSW